MTNRKQLMTRKPMVAMMKRWEPMSTKSLRMGSNRNDSCGTTMKATIRVHWIRHNGCQRRIE